jgi:hypothetical protein
MSIHMRPFFRPVTGWLVTGGAFMGSSLVRKVMVATAAGCYLLALAMPAYYESAPAIDGYHTFSGLECLLSPVMVGPIVLLMHLSWWANPLYFVGMLSLCRRSDAPALACGIFAIPIALLFLGEAHDPYGDRVRLGFWFWLASIVAVAIGALAMMVMEHRTSHCT